MSEEPKEEDFEFSIDETVEVKEKAGFASPMAPGIHQNLKLSEVRYVTPDKDDHGAKWKEGIEFLFEATAVTFKRDNNGNLDYSPNGDKIIISKPGQQVSKREFWDDDKPADKKKKIIARIKHIMTKFMPEDQAVIGKKKDFKGLALAVVKKLDEHKEGKKVRIKVTQNGKFTNIPSYFPFIESMGTKGSQLTMSAKEYEVEEASNLDNLDMEGEIAIPDDL